MIDRAFQNQTLPALGFGTMRLPVLDGDDSRIDERATEEMVDYAMAHGVTYFDTAWGYHGGNSERVIGRLLAKYPRDSFYLADKFPGYDLNNLGRVEEIFEEQLQRCGVDYFDFYLYHNVSEVNIDGYLDKRHGIFPYLMEQKRQGRIRHLGFSAHGGIKVMRRFLAAYGAHMEFCLLQINYIDWTFQQAREKVALLREYGIPVMVMEPLRGGRLVSLPEEYAAQLSALRPRESQAGWAFRFLQSLPEVVTTLTGMSDFRQVKENVETYGQEAPLSRNEMDALLRIGQEMSRKNALPCTGCKYCLTYCSEKLNIPELLGLYNEHVFSGGGFLAPMVLQTIPKEKHPGACIGCGACEEVCPQQLKISEAMAHFDKMLHPKKAEKESGDA